MVNTRKQCRVVALQLPGFESQLCCLPAVWPWASYLTSLSLYLHIIFVVVRITNNNYSRHLISLTNLITFILPMLEMRKLRRRHYARRHTLSRFLEKVRNSKRPYSLLLSSLMS